MEDKVGVTDFSNYSKVVVHKNMFRSMNMIPTMSPQTACACFHCTVNQGLIACNVRQACVLHDRPRINVVPTPAPILHPQQPRTVSERPNVMSADRTVYLRKSVFSLIYENIYLALTDSKLLGWYLALSPEDRRLIQDGGGFNQFLRKHPALELSRHHVYVKKSRENFPLCSDSNCYNHHQGNRHISYSSPASQSLDPKAQALSELTWLMANPNGDHYGFKNPEQLTNWSLNVEMERHSWNPQSTAFDSIGDAMTGGSGHETSQNEDFYSILEADGSIVLCVPNQSPDTSQINAGEFVSENEASIMESIIRTTEDRSTSPMTPVCACDATVGTAQTMTMSALSQTEPQQMTDRHLNTEVYMLDLDYLTKEFITIKTERDELLEKVKMQRITSPLARIVNDLKKLETDYNKMREKILSGISLQDLKPFSLDEEETVDSTVTTISDIQKASASSPKQREPMNEIPAPSCDNTNNPQEREITDSTKCDSSKSEKAFTRVPKEKGTNQRTDRKPSDSLSSEDWFDAEEDFPSEGSGVQLKEDEEAGARTSEKPKSVSAGVCVTGLHTNVTETDVMMWFQKYNVSEVHISNLKKLCVAIVIMGSQESAEAAVRELNGLRIKGQSLKVEHINCGRSEDQGQSSTGISDTESSNNPSKIQNLPPASSSKKKVVCVSPTAQGTFVPQHYGTMGSFDILMSELTQRHPNLSRQRIVDALLELRAKYRGVLSGLPLRTIRDMTSDLLTRPAKT